MNLNDDMFLLDFDDIKIYILKIEHSFINNDIPQNICDSCASLPC